MRVVIFGLLLALTQSCWSKGGASSLSAAPHALIVESLASFAFLQEVEAEDPYIAAALSEEDVERETAKRAEAYAREADENKNGKIDESEQARVKALVSDRMLELFDIDSDGSFNETERDAIRGKIHDRIEASRKQVLSPKS